MNEIIATVRHIFTNMDLNDKNIIPKIKAQFNVLDQPDSEWIEIEESVIKLIKQLKK